MTDSRLNKYNSFVIRKRSFREHKIVFVSILNCESTLPCNVPVGESFRTHTNHILREPLLSAKMSVPNSCCKIFNHRTSNRDSCKLSRCIILCNLSSTLPSTTPGRCIGSAVLAPRILNIKVTWTNCLLKSPAALHLEQKPWACSLSASQRQSAGCRKEQGKPLFL